MTKIFIYDRILEEEDICNFTHEIAALRQQVEAGGCVRLYGLRNFGKTSILRNAIGKWWLAANQKKRIFLYVDFYSIQTFHDISSEIALAFNRAFSTKGGLLQWAKDWMTILKNIKPTWSPNENGVGEFSFTTTKGEQTPDFELIFENIDKLQRSGKFEFFIVLDEFQEVARIPKAEAKLRGALQTLSHDIAVIISGSKPHLLKKIFDQPKAPFHSWGNTMELDYIDYPKYHQYMQERFAQSGKEIGLEASIYLQRLMHRIPESINRICEFIRIDDAIDVIAPPVIDRKLIEFIDRARSTYESMLANFTEKEKIVVKAMAKEKKVYSTMSLDFLQKVPISKSGVNAIVNRLLDRSTIYHLLDDNQNWYYQLADPLFSQFILRYK